MKLTPEQKDELERICRNDAAFGAFSGMVFNAWRDYSLASYIHKMESELSMEDVIDGLIQQALEVRVALRQLSQ